MYSHTMENSHQVIQLPPIKENDGQQSHDVINNGIFQFETDDELSLLVAAAATALLDGRYHQNQIIPEAHLTQGSQMTDVSSQDHLQFDRDSPNRIFDSSTSLESLFYDGGFLGRSHRSSLPCAYSSGELVELNTPPDKPTPLAIWGSSHIWDKICDHDIDSTYHRNSSGLSHIPSHRFPPSKSNVEDLVQLRDSKRQDEMKSDKVHASAFLFTSGVGGRHFSPPIVLAHPEEFRNPSSFLKVYGDPLCGLEDKGAKVDKNNGNMMKGKNGNWTCCKCGNVNYPRRFRCNKCAEIRDSAGDALVGDYALQVYHHHMTSYKKLGGGRSGSGQSNSQLGQTNNSKNSHRGSAQRIKCPTADQQMANIGDELSQSSTDFRRTTEPVLRRFNSYPVNHSVETPCRGIGSRAEAGLLSGSPIKFDCINNVESFGTPQRHTPCSSPAHPYLKLSTIGTPTKQTAPSTKSPHKSYHPELPTPSALRRSIKSIEQQIFRNGENLQ